jgi:hypothetical protein
MRWVAKGEITAINDDTFRFLAVSVEIERGTTPVTLIRKIQRSIDQELARRHAQQATA